MTQEEQKIIASSILVFAALTLMQCKINPKRINRFKQMLMPYISIVYSIVAIVYVYNKYSELYTRFGKYLKYLTRFDITAADVLVVNVVIFSTYVAGRIIPTIIWVIAFRNRVILTQYLNIFYVYDDNFGEWLLRDKFTGLRDVFKALTCSSVVVCGIITGYIWIKGPTAITHVYVFPALLLLVIAEIYNFLNGITQLEYENSITGDDSYAQKIRNFYKIREIYEKIFVHEVLTSDTGCDFGDTQSVTNLLEDLTNSDIDARRKLAEFYKLNGTPESYDADYISASLTLLEGHNVLFYDPFYRDFDKYLILPALYHLLSYKKILIVTGRESIKKDISKWFSHMLTSYGKIESLWRVRALDYKDPECEVGIIGSSELYDSAVLEANSKFLSDVGLVIMIEISHIINTGQIGLSILASIMAEQGALPEYCFLDRISDGLVDSLSHILQIEITDVEAPPVSRNIHTSMAFNVEGDFLREKLFEKQTGYLGNGIELAAVAIKNQIPKVSWYSESKSPIRDIKWIAGQYFGTICKYMNIPIQQESLYERIKFISNIWSMPSEDYQFIIAEDEFCNIFNTMRMFLSRGKEQSFVNVLSENYLLRDYMRCNVQMFVSNPDAIPSIIPDYAKTERNVLIKLLLEMSIREVMESEILNEFRLVGIENDDALSIMTEMLLKYLDVDNSIFNIRVVKHEHADHELDEENAYSIMERTFNERFRKNLRYAYYICEDEDKEEHIDARLFGHITQSILPGQFVVYDGKYYIVHDISTEKGVILRRASNLYDGRKYYRQMREYIVGDWNESAIISSRTVMDIEFTKLNLSFEVRTYGYLEMNGNCDLRSARLVDMRKDPRVDEYAREYHNKKAMLIKLPDTDRNVRFTVSILLSELFKSVFPDAWEYICVTTVIPDDVDGMLNYLTYDVSGAVDEDSIIIFEDSEMDLGLLEAVEKNMIKFLEIITDFLGWHFEKMRESAHEDPIPVTTEFPAVDHKRRKKKTDLLKRIRDIFGIKKEDDVRIPTIERAEAAPPKKKEDNAVSSGTPAVAPVNNAGGRTPAPATEPAAVPAEPKIDYAYSLDVGEDEAVVTIEKTVTEDTPENGSADNVMTESTGISDTVSVTEPVEETASSEETEASEKTESSEETESTEESVSSEETASSEETVSSEETETAEETDTAGVEAAQKEGSQTADNEPSAFSGSNDESGYEEEPWPVERSMGSAQGQPESRSDNPEPQKNIHEGDNPELFDTDGTDIFDETGSHENEEYLEKCFVEMGIVSPDKSRYQNECFLKFGFDFIDNRLKIEDVHKYLTVRGFSNNAFRKARTRDPFEDTLIDLEAVNHCDFCGIPISGVSYERLTDGRIRCNDCSSSAITSIEEFRKIFLQTQSLMMSFYDIDFHVGLNIRTVDARKVAAGYGSVYKPSTEYAARVIGYAKKSGGKYEICIENGSPRLASISTIVHELTHIWQYINWDEKEIKKNYPSPDQRDMVYEGMAVWAEIQYMYLIGENSYALKQEIMRSSQEDIYGYGFKLYRERYPLIKDSSLIKHSPFTQFPPL